LDGSILGRRLPEPDESDSAAAPETPLLPLPAFHDAETLLPVVVQDAATGRVLMQAYMNHAAWQATVETGEAVYYSRSRKRLWKKGEDSGNIQRVQAAFVDCDGDSILLKVEQVGGAACHEGFASCYFRRLEGDKWVVEEPRVFDPAAVYGKKDVPPAPDQS
jgi:phosphoribosyl-AMP cyclohydrolase